MKVCLLADALIPPLTGIGRYAWALAEGIEQSTQADTLSFVSYKGRHTMESLREQIHGYEEITGNFEGEDRRRSSRPGSQYLKWNAKTRAWLINWALVSAAYRLQQELSSALHLSRIKPQVVHGPNYHIPLKVPRKTARVVTIHDLSTSVAPQWHPEQRVVRMNQILPRSVGLADRIVVDSTHCADTLSERLRVARDKIDVVPLGVDDAFFNADLVPVSERHYTLCVSTIEPRKNIDTLLTAYAALTLEMRKAFPLVIVGESGWHSAETHARVQKFAQEGWLRYEGFVSERRLIDLYAHARLCVYPSLYEGFGLPILEAFATGCPLIAGHNSSIPEVAGNHATLLADVTDVEAMRSAIAAELDSPWSEKAEMIRRQYATKFEWKATVQATIDVYRKAIDSR